jgi:hypothetical protein
MWSGLAIVLNLYLVNLFGYPFGGDLTVSSHPFETDVALFDFGRDGLSVPAPKP